MHELRAQILIKVQRDLAVGARAQTMAGLLEGALHAFVIVELAVDDDPGGFVLVGDRLIARHEIDDGKARVPEADASIGRNPGALSIGSAMMKARHAAIQGLRRDRPIL
jgi:hypothetical protein